MGTDKQCMGWIKDKIGLGLPSAIGGIPLEEIGATGIGLAACVDGARELVGLDLKGACVAVQGFGAVGKHAARFLAEKGCVLIAASDSAGTLADPSGSNYCRHLIGFDVVAINYLQGTSKNSRAFVLVRVCCLSA